MQHPLINLSQDLKQLADEGYELEVMEGFLLLRGVPFVTEERTIERGILVSALDLAGDVTAKPKNHVAMFRGRMPHDDEGRPLDWMVASANRQDLGGGLQVDYQFSRRPVNGYSDYHHKMTTYEAIISRYARKIDPDATAKTFGITEPHDDDSVFLYADTATSRARIGLINNKLKVNAVAIVGLGGTGSYILDLVAKTPVREIHLFDGDKLGQHNAFRSPGATSIDALRAQKAKASHYRDVYSKMRTGIFSHGYMDESSIDDLQEMSFVFIAVDKSLPRKLLVEKLDEFRVPFIDVGMGVVEEAGSLFGQLRVTLSNEATQDQARSRLPLADNDAENEYAQNIQLADLNALNAALAVIKWKKCLGFYLDAEREHSSLYQIDGNFLVNIGGDFGSD